MLKWRKMSTAPRDGTFALFGLRRAQAEMYGVYAVIAHCEHGRWEFWGQNVNGESHDPDFFVGWQRIPPPPPEAD